MSSTGTSDSTCSNLTAAAPPDAGLFSAAVECAGVGSECLARFRIEINHVTTAIELKLGAPGWVESRHMIKNVTRHGIGRDHVRVTVGNKKAERRVIGQQCTQIILGAGLHA